MYQIRTTFAELPGDFNRRGQARRILLAIILALTFEIVDVGFKNLAGRSDLVIPLLYANVLTPLVVVWWMLWRGGLLRAMRWRCSIRVGGLGCALW